MSLGLNTVRTISDEDLSLFSLIETHYNVDTVDVEFINRCHSYSIPLGGDINPQVHGVEETKRRIQIAASNGLDFIYLDHFFLRGILPSAVNDCFSYAHSLGLKTAMADTTLTDENIDFYRSYLLGHVDMLGTMAYLDLAANRRSVDLLDQLKYEFSIPYVFAWVNIANKGDPTYDWVNVGMPTAEYALSKIDGSWFWWYIPPDSIQPSLCKDPKYDCVYNFQNVKNWILGLPTCECTGWMNAECVNQTYRRQVRTCTPTGCKAEERLVYDPTCAPPPPRVPWELVFGAMVIGGVIYYAVGPR